MNGEIRLGGMALENGVLVHGPRHWACAVRTDEGELKVASGEKRLKAVDAGSRFTRATPSWKRWPSGSKRRSGSRRR